MKGARSLLLFKKPKKVKEKETTIRKKEFKL